MKPNRSEWPLTRFLGMLLCYTDEQLAGASGAKAAKRYGISEAHASGYIAMERTKRGLAV